MEEIQTTSEAPSTESLEQTDAAQLYAEMQRQKVISIILLERDEVQTAIHRGDDYLIYEHQGKLDARMQKLYTSPDFSEHKDRSFQSNTIREALALILSAEKYGKALKNSINFKLIPEEDTEDSWRKES